MFQRYTDLQIIAHAVGMWSNYIETNNVTLSSLDAQNCGREDEIKALDSSQQQFLVRLQGIKSKALVQDGTRREIDILRDVIEEICHDQLDQGSTLQKLLEIKNPELAEEFRQVSK